MIYNKDYTKFNTILNNRRVLYIPIISCINRQTNEYNLACDGNVIQNWTELSDYLENGILPNADFYFEVD